MTPDAGKPQSPSPFVQVGTIEGRPTFVLGGRPFEFVGANAYYLHEDAARELKGVSAAQGLVDEALSKMNRLGITVVRAWAFNDEPEKDTVLQRAPLVYDEANLVGLDAVIARAGARGLKLILPLLNYWNAYGGARQYVAWHGLSNPVEGDPRFFTDPGVRAHFEQHIERLLTRVNTFTGIEYRNDPTILGWEICNELRGTGLGDDGTKLRAFIDAIADKIHRVDPHHLVSTGEEGFDASPSQGYDAGFWETVSSWGFHTEGSFRLNTASPGIDFASVHLYPEQWGWPKDQTAEAGKKWIAEHVALARGLGKPLVLGEFGLGNRESVGRGNFELADRRRIYADWFESALASGAAGVMPWLFAYDARPDSWDDHTFYLKNGTLPSAPENRYADIVEAAAARRRAGSLSRAPQ